MYRFIMLGFAAALMVGCPHRNHDTLSVAGQIEGVSVDAGSKVGGRIAEVFFEEGDPVERDAVLVTLEDHEAEAQLAMARARLAQAAAQLTKIERGPRTEEIRQAEAALQRQEEQYRMALQGARPQEIDSALAQVNAARAQRDDAAAEFRRAERLREQGVVSEQMYDRAQHALEAAEAQLKAARDQYDLILDGTRAEEVAMAQAARDEAAAVLEALRTGAREEDIASARAMRDEAEAALRMAEANAREMVIKAPFNGMVESLDVRPGDLVQPGPLVRVTDPDRLELWVYVSAAVLGRIRVGQEVTLTTDSHGDREFTGRVLFIASEGEFTPRNLQTQEQRVQQMFGVKLALDSADGLLRAGMTATAHFDLTGEG